MEYQEKVVFDYYDNVLKLKKEKEWDSPMICETDMPIVEINSERLIYIIKNKVDQTPKSLLLLPFLHNRNVLMRQIDTNREYFSCMLKKEGKDKKKKEGRILRKHLIIMNMSNSVVTTFSEHGLQTKRYLFTKKTKKYGKPKAVSQNGQFFIFGKKKTLEISILMLTNKKMVHLKEINLEKDLKEYLSKTVNSVQESQGAMLEGIIIYGVHRDFTDHTKYNYTMQINDNLDICVMFQPKNQVREDRKDDEGKETMR